jgi:hypothetical protein
MQKRVRFVIVVDIELGGILHFGRLPIQEKLGMPQRKRMKTKGLVRVRKRRLLIWIGYQRIKGNNAITFIFQKIQVVGGKRDEEKDFRLRQL